MKALVFLATNCFRSYVTVRSGKLNFLSKRFVYKLSAMWLVGLSLSACTVSSNQPYEFSNWKYQDEVCDDQEDTRNEGRGRIDAVTKERLYSRLVDNPIKFVFNEGEPYEINIVDIVVYENEGQGILVDLRQNTISDTSFYMVIDNDEALVLNYVCSKFR